MTQALPKGVVRGKPCQVSPAVLYLCSEDSPNGIILQASGGQFSILKMCVTNSIDLGEEVEFEAFAEAAPNLLEDLPRN